MDIHSVRQRQPVQLHPLDAAVEICDPGSGGGDETFPDQWYKLTPQGVWQDQWELDMELEELRQAAISAELWYDGF